MASPKKCSARCENELASQARFKSASARTPFAAGHRTRDCGAGCAREIDVECNAVGENRGLLESPRIPRWRIAGRERSECGISGRAKLLLVTAQVADEPRHRGLPASCRSERVRTPALPSHRADRGWPRLAAVGGYYRREVIAIHTAQELEATLVIAPRTLTRPR